MKSKKTKKGKKKKKRVTVAVKEFSDCEFYQSYVERIFKDLVALKKLNSIEEFNRAVGAQLKAPP